MSRQHLSKEEKAFLQKLRNSIPEPAHVDTERLRFRWPTELRSNESGAVDDYLEKARLVVQGCYTIYVWTYDGRTPLFYEIEP